MTTTYYKNVSVSLKLLAVAVFLFCVFIYLFIYNQALKMHFSTISATLNTLVAVTSICSTATSHLLDTGATGEGSHSEFTMFSNKLLTQDSGSTAGPCTKQFL